MDGTLFKKIKRKIKYLYTQRLLFIRAFPRLLKLFFLSVNIFSFTRSKIQNICLIGDFSGLHLNLKQGFTNIGCYSSIYADGDGFKNIPYDNFLVVPPSDEVERLIYFLIDQPLFLNLLFFKSDVVQIMSARFIYTPDTWQTRYLKYLNMILRKSRARFVLTVAGCDHRTHKTLSEAERSPCPGCLKDMNEIQCFLTSQRHQELQTFVESKIDAIMPFGGMSYFRAYSKATDCLPFPLEVTDKCFTGNYPNGKIKILHGISRPGFKGSDIIISALSRLEKSIPNDVEIIVVEKLALEQYILCLKDVNIVIDQVFGDGLSYNSLYSMSLGKIVFTSHSPAWILSLYGNESPAIDFWDEDSLYEGLVKTCALSYEEINLLGRKAYEFVKNFASPQTIASKALSFY